MPIVAKIAIEGFAAIKNNGTIGLLRLLKLFKLFNDLNPWNDFEWRRDL